MHAPQERLGSSGGSRAGACTSSVRKGAAHLRKGIFRAGHDENGFHILTFRDVCDHVCETRLVEQDDESARIDDVVTLRLAKVAGCLSS